MGNRIRCRAAEYRRHVLALAESGAVQVTFVDDPGPEGGHAFPDHRSVYVPRIKGPDEYILALHELGHILSSEAYGFHRQDPDGRDLRVTLLAEGAAWAWAAVEALPVPPATWFTAGDALVSYFQLPGRSAA